MRFSIALSFLYGLCLASRNLTLHQQDMVVLRKRQTADHKTGRFVPFLHILYPAVTTTATTNEAIAAPTIAATRGPYLQCAKVKTKSEKVKHFDVVETAANIREWSGRICQTFPVMHFTAFYTAYVTGWSTDSADAEVDCKLVADAVELLWERCRDSGGTTNLNLLADGRMMITIWWQWANPRDHGHRVALRLDECTELDK